MLNRSASLAMSTCVLKAEPGKLESKRREPGILFISYSWLNTLQTSDYDVIFDICVDSASLATSFVIQKVQRHHDLIKVTCREIGNVY